MNKPIEDKGDKIISDVSENIEKTKPKELEDLISGFRGILENRKIDNMEGHAFQSAAWKETVYEWEQRMKSKDTSRLEGYLKEQSKSGKPDKAIVQAIINILKDREVIK